MQLQIKDALQQTGHGFYNYAVLVACLLLTTASVIDVFGIAVILPAATCDLKLGLTETGLLASVSFIGCLCAVPWGLYADIGGRRTVLLLSALFGFLFSFSSSFSPNWQVLFGLKLIGCSFSTAGLMIPMVYIGEFTGEKYKDKFISFVNCSYIASDIVMYGLAYFILPYDYSIHIPWISIKFRPWRAYMIVMSILMGLAFLTLLLLHESPQFLVNKGKNKEALEVLKIMHKANGRSNDNFKIEQLQQVNNEKQSLCMFVSKQVVEIFKPPLFWKTLQISHLFTVCNTTLNVFYSWFPVLINRFFNSISINEENSSFCERIVANVSTYNELNGPCNDDVSMNTIYAGIIYGIVLTCLNLALAVVARWRKWMLISVLTVSAGSAILLNVLTHPIVCVILYSLLLITIIGHGNVSSYAVDIYTASNRSLVIGMNAMLAKLFSFAGTNLLSVVVVDHCNLLFYSWSFYIFTGIITAALLPASIKPK